MSSRTSGSPVPPSPDGAAQDASSLPERERERGFTRERKRDPVAQVPFPGHVNKEVEKTWPGSENRNHAA